MLYFNRIYKQILACLILGAYLLSSLSLPIFEGIHFVLHLGDDAQLHTFVGHHTTHQHTSLNLIDDLVDNSPSELPKESPTTKKNKIIDQVYCWQKLVVKVSTVQESSRYFFFQKHYLTPFQSVDSPPPRV